MESLGEEIIDADGNIVVSRPLKDDDGPTADLPGPAVECNDPIDLKAVDSINGEERQLSFDTQAGISVAPPKSPRSSKSRNSISSRG